MSREIFLSIKTHPYSFKGGKPVWLSVIHNTICLNYVKCLIKLSTCVTAFEMLHKKKLLGRKQENSCVRKRMFSLLSSSKTQMLTNHLSQQIKWTLKHGNWATNCSCAWYLMLFKKEILLLISYMDIMALFFLQGIIFRQPYQQHSKKSKVRPV